MKVKISEKEYSKKILKSEHPHSRKLTQNYWFIIDGTEYIIKRGFWWNGASIPKFAWSLIGGPYSDDVYFGALIHDMLYGAHVFKRGKCDEVFYQVNSLSGMGWVKNNTMLKNLQVFGWMAYDSSPEEIYGNAKHLLINGKPFEPIYL